MLGALLGEPGAKGRDHLVQQDNAGGNFGLRVGDWKLVRMKAKNKPQATVTREARRPVPGEWSLYFLPDDPGEHRDLAAKRPSN